jgi:hypothetical protein
MFVIAVLLMPVAIWLVAAFQEAALLFIASRFLGLKLSGKTFWSCVAGILAGGVGSKVVEAYGGELLALVVFLLATWPFLAIWTKNKTEGDVAVALTNKQAAILSASSSFAAVIFIYIVGFIFSLLFGVVLLTTILRA